MTVTTDRNSQFATEKTAQLNARRTQRQAAIDAAADKREWLDTEIAEGRLTPTGPNQYRITQGWDAGETITINLDTQGQIAEIVPDHGLHTTPNGAVALATTVPAWHTLGTLIPAGTTDIDTFLGPAGLDFTVEKVPDMYAFGGEIRTDPDTFKTIRTDTGAPLGTVGRTYTVYQNRDWFTFLQDLVGSGEVAWETAGLLDGGKRGFISLRLPHNVIVDPGGIDDTVIPFLAAFISHDGRHGNEVDVTPWRPLCGNTVRWAVRDASARWTTRHTKNIAERVAEARRTLGLATTYYEQFAAEETALARIDAEIDTVRALLDDLWPLPEDATTRQARYAADRTDRIIDLYRSAPSLENCRGTAYAAEQAVADYLDHVAPRRPSKTMSEELRRARIALEGDDDDLKARAHKRLMRIVRQ